jgi:hypothetical protein
MKLRPFLTVLLAFWLAFGPVATAWAAYVATPCESIGGMNQPLPADDCCGDAMDASECLGACIAAFPAAAAPAMQVLEGEGAGSAIPGLFLRYATILAPPDITPPKPFVS